MKVLGPLFPAVATVLLAIAVGGLRRPASGATTQTPAAPATVDHQVLQLNRQLEAVKSEYARMKSQVARAQAVLSYSTKYQIPADLAGAIYDAAQSEGIDPAIAFRLVKIESNFDGTARSPRGAIGYAQVRLATARQYLPELEERHLYRRDVNLTVGFRVLKDLLRRFDGNIDLALLAYNRGPGRVEQIIAEGGDPSNGYADQVLKRKKPALPPAPVIEPES
ncbi:MAG: lytic transglycosylase domain-containing protein [Gemmatimonadota bacterium]